MKTTMHTMAVVAGVAFSLAENAVAAEVEGKW